MEATALPLVRGAEVDPLSPVATGAMRRPHLNSAMNLSPRPEHENEAAYLLRRVSSYQDGYTPREGNKGRPGYGRQKSRLSYGARPFSTDDSFLSVTTTSYQLDSPKRHREPSSERIKRAVMTTMVNLTSGVIAFLLSSTLAVSCASVVVGHGTPLATVIADFIDQNLLGTAVMCVVLAWQSQAPWTLGAIDVFVYVSPFSFIPAD